MHTMATHDPETAQTWRKQFTSTARCVSLVRTQVEKKLCDWGFAYNDVTTAVLVASELAANAVVHGHVPGHLFEVQLTRSAQTCLIEVSDRSPRTPRALAAAADDEHGRGLQLARALALEVGHRPRKPVGKTVWARLAMTPEHPAPASPARQHPGEAQTAEGQLPAGDPYLTSLLGCLATGIGYALLGTLTVNRVARSSRIKGEANLW